MSKVVCPDCHKKFNLPEAVVENIRALRKKTEMNEVPVTVWLDIDELTELVGQANEVGVGVDDYIVSNIQNLT